MHYPPPAAETRYNRDTLPGSLPWEPGRRAHFRAALLRWFDGSRRDLPWRRTRHPYRIWVAEIMLQQTRVSAVIQRYAEFLRRFPNVQSLARARLPEVLAAWSGLGYYRRARALHAAARVIARRRSDFPRTSAAWRELPGIGRYTAAAIASIAWDEPSAVLDGNVERVLRRLLGRKNASAASLWDIAGQLLSAARPGDFNQAMMELGATVCLPRQPRCRECPVRSWCETRGAPAPTPQPARRKKEVAFTLLRRGDSVCLVRRRASESLMPGLWELPEISRECPKRAGLARLGTGLMPPPGAPLFSLRHAITITDYRVHVYAGVPCGCPTRAARWIHREDLAALPLTGLARKILRHAGLI